MPPRNNNLPVSPLRSRGGATSAPPPVMTWKKASLILVAAGLFDAMRAFFNMFWFFGPALAAWYCTNVASGWVGDLWGLTAGACTVISIKTGVVASAITIPLGTVMADATTLLGYLTVGMLVIMTNMRILKTVGSGVLKFSGSAAASAMPIIGALPFFTFTLWRMYRTQIRLEKAAYKKWEKETAAARLQQRNQQAMQIAQIQASRQMQFQQEQIMQQEAANAAAYEQEQAANDDVYDESLENVSGATTKAANDGRYTEAHNGALPFLSKQGQNPPIGKTNIPQRMNKAA